MSSRVLCSRKVKLHDVPEPLEVAEDQLEAIAREGARQMLASALEEERDAYLGRGRYERSGAYRGYRSGGVPRRLTLGAGTVELAVCRVRDIPRGEEPFESKILRKYQRRSDTIDGTFLNLFVEELVTRDCPSGAPAVASRASAE